MTETRCIRDGLVADPPAEIGRLLALVQEPLEEARAAGRPVLKLGPEDVERLCWEAGVEGRAAGSFGALVRQNLVRLRGRWREDRSAVRAPVYVERVTEAGLRLLEERGESRVRRSGSADNPYYMGGTS
jgi:hypothetical protein